MKKLKMKWVNTALLSLMMTASTASALSGDLYLFKGSPALISQGSGEFEISGERLRAAQRLLFTALANDFHYSARINKNLQYLRSEDKPEGEAAWHDDVSAKVKPLAFFNGFREELPIIDNKPLPPMLREWAATKQFQIHTDSGELITTTGAGIVTILQAHPGEKVKLKN